MVKYTLAERWEILKVYFQSDCQVAETVRKLKTNFEKDRAPSKQYVSFFVNKVRTTGLLIDSPNRNKPNTVRTPALVQVVAENVRESPKLSTRHRSQQLHLSRATIMRILHEDLGMSNYKSEHQLDETPTIVIDDENDNQYGTANEKQQTDKEIS